MYNPDHVSALVRDVILEMRARERRLWQKATECEHAYEINRCWPGERVPALQESCSQWEACKNTGTLTTTIDLKEHSWCTIAMIVIGRAVNAFFGQLTWTAFLRVLLCLASSCFCCFSLNHTDYRNKTDV
eukprot:Filipodium_phascolosomae@DN8486_c0_g1_i1.p1